MFLIKNILKNYIIYKTFNYSNEELIKIIKEEIPEFYYYLQKCEDEIEYFDFTLNFFINDYLFQMNNMIDNNDYTEYNNIVLKRTFLILIDNLFKIKN